MMQPNTPKKLLFEILFTLIFLILVFIVYLLWERTRDPLKAINNIDLNVRKVSSQTTLDSLIAGKRYYSDIHILSEETDTIKAIISFPPGYSNRRLPVITILGGLRIARENFSFIKNPGQNIIIIYIYPYQAEQWQRGFILSEIPKVRSAILQTPGQIAELMHWTQQQEWADTNKVSLLGYSFGALFTPAVEQVAAQNHIRTGPLIISYGGADFDLLLQQNLKVKPKWLRPLIAWFGSTLIYSVDPIHHAPKMKGNIYLINGRHDNQIPKDSWQLLHRLAPATSKIDILDEGHMHPRKPELTQKLVDMSRQWLKKQGILN